MTIKHPIWGYGFFQPSILWLAVCLATTGTVYLPHLRCPTFWVNLFLGLALIALMLVVVMSFDYLPKFALKLHMFLVDRLASSHSIFRTALIFTIWHPINPLKYSMSYCGSYRLKTVSLVCKYLNNFLPEKAFPVSIDSEPALVL